MRQYNKKKISDALLMVREFLCAYPPIQGRPPTSPPGIRSRCDCKFGATAIGQRHEVGNGCPEVATAAEVLARRIIREGSSSVRLSFSKKRLIATKLENYK